MKMIRSTNKYYVYAEWLKRELYRVKPGLTESEIFIIENPDLESLEENRKREVLLLSKYNRSQIIEKLPAQLDWYEAIIEEEDVERLFLLPTWDWFLDSGQTFQLIRVPSHLSPIRGHRFLMMPNHHKKIERIPLSENSQPVFIAIASKQNGPYTIIEGTHCAIKFLMMNRLIGTRCFLGLCDDLSRCYWSIEREDIQTHLESLRQMVNLGIMW